MAIFTGVFKNLSRRPFRTILVGLVLAICVGVLISTVAGMQVSQDSTREMVNNVTSGTNEFVETVESSTQAMITDVENRAADTVAKITQTTDDMVAQVIEGAEQTVGITELMEKMITVSAMGVRFNVEGRMGPGGNFGNLDITGDITRAGITDEEVEVIKGLPDVDMVLKISTARIGTSAPESTEGMRIMNYDYQIIGVPIDSTLDTNYQLLPSIIIDGRSLESGDTTGVMININLLDYFNMPEIGDTVTLVDTEYQLVGVFLDTTILTEKAIYMSIEKAEEFASIYEIPNNNITLRVYASSTVTVDSVAAEIEELYPNWMVRTPADAQTAGFTRGIATTQEDQVDRIQRSAQQQIDLLESNAASQISEMQANAEAQVQKMQSDAEAQIASMEDDLGRIENMGYLIGIISAIAGILIIFGIMFYIVRERTREIGIYKALGFSNGNVMFRFILEGSFVGVLGGLLGAALALASYSQLVQRFFTVGDTVPGPLNPYYLIIGLGIAVLFATLGSLYPAWRAAHISPLVALQNNK
jgi:ABC-type antimicrobial peptide transport system permease subunit